MIAAAAFSHRPWESGAPDDTTEDLLHSVAATAMGFAFAGGVLAVAFRDGFDKPPRAFDVIAIASTVILPLGMTFLPDYDGLLQRLMFLIAYFWFARDALVSARMTQTSR